MRAVALNMMISCKVCTTCCQPVICCNYNQICECMGKESPGQKKSGLG